MHHINVRHLDQHLRVKAERVSNKTEGLLFRHSYSPIFFVRLLWYASIVSGFFGFLSDMLGIGFSGPKSFFDFGFTMIASSWELLNVPQ